MGRRQLEDAACSSCFQAGQVHTGSRSSSCLAHLDMKESPPGVTPASLRISWTSFSRIPFAFNFLYCHHVQGMWQRKRKSCFHGRVQSEGLELDSYQRECPEATPNLWYVFQTLVLWFTASVKTSCNSVRKADSPSFTPLLKIPTGCGNLWQTSASASKRGLEIPDTFANSLMSDSEHIAVGDVHLSKDEQCSACAPSEACFAVISLQVCRKY